MRPSLVALLSLFRLIKAVDSSWALLWSDEFEGDSLNENAWTKEVGFLGYNSEFQTYTDSPLNVYVEDGKLHIAAIRDLTAQVGYTSGRINTMDKVQIKYGMVEASVKIPSMKKGLWPAFWTLGQNYPQVGWPKAGELDILEAGQKLGSSQGLGNQRIVTAVHWDAFGEYVVEDGHIDMPYDLSAGFHNYKMIWQPDSVKMFVDDNLVQHTNIDYCSTLWDCQELHQHHFLVLNVAVSGMFTCCEYGFDLNESPNGTAWTMEVDYVRIYGNEHTDVLLPEGGLNSTKAPAPATPTTTHPTIAYTTVSTKAPTVSPSGSLTTAGTIDEPPFSITSAATMNPTSEPSQQTPPTSSLTVDEWRTSMPTSLEPTLGPSPIPSMQVQSITPTANKSTQSTTPSLRPTNQDITDTAYTANPSDASSVMGNFPDFTLTMAPTEETAEILGELEGLLSEDNTVSVVPTSSPTISKGDEMGTETSPSPSSSPTDMDGFLGFSNDEEVQAAFKAPTASPGSSVGDLTDSIGGARPQVEVGLISAGCVKQNLFQTLLLALMASLALFL